MIVETSPAVLNPGLTRGLHPLRFVRELYCLDGKLRPFAGAADERRGCPVSFDAGAFVAAHPALFSATGWAHHPYSLTTSPATPDRNRDDATLSGVPKLTRTLDRATASYGQPKHFPIWLTEYGYQTDPPDPTIGVSFAQFLLVDDGPLRQYKSNDPRYWGTFQSGLITPEGKHKPAYESFKRPISLMRRGRGLRVFGQLRTAGGRRASVQFRRLRAKSWKTVATAGANDHGFVLVSLSRARAGSYRIAWSGDGTSRAVAIRSRR